MRVGVLGPLAVDTTSGALGPRDRVVLSVLVLHGSDGASADRLADALWGDEPPASSGKVVQGCIVRLRKALGPGAIETHATGYRLVLGADDVDLHQFERLLGRAREQLALRAPDRALRTAEEALALWRGRPFEDVEGWDAARIEAARLDALRQEAEELRVDAALRAGRHHEVLAVARGLVDAAPTRERRWELLALAQYRSGSQADALRTLHEARRRLADELGLDPGPGMVELEQAILRQDEELNVPTVPSIVDDTCPWPGLLAYTAEDAEEFAGREREIDACLARLATDGVLVVVGPSGSGKSSLVRAGVAGKLERDGRRVVILTPGSRPLDALARRAPTDDCVLVIDQCEEVVTTCDDPDGRDAFFDALAAHAARAPLVVVLRADRLGDLSGHPAFARLVERGLFLLGPMDEPALRAAIERPARAAGLLLEPGLVDLIVRDVLDEPGALPLMSHALQQTWTRRDGRTLTVTGYTETGGIRSAVAQSAEAVYAGVDLGDQPKLRNLLLRLVTPVEDGAPARARLPRRAIADDPGFQRLVDQLVEARLLTTDGDTVELAHEALARAWPRFKDWLEEDVEGLRVLRHLNVAAAGWDALGRPHSELYRGERLAGAVAWRERTDPELTAIEAAFIEASIEQQREELRAAEVQVERERHTVRRLRRLVAGVGVLAVVALVAGAVALQQRDQADDHAQEAEARRLSAEALDSRPHDRALLLALEAVRRWEDPETQGALLTTIGRSPQVVGVMRSAGAPFLDVDLPPTGGRVAVSDDDGDLTLYDRSTREPVATLATDGITHRNPLYSPDGRSLATTWMATSCMFTACGDVEEGVDPFGVDVYGADDLDGEAVRYRWPLSGPPVEVAWSPDGRHLAAAAPFFFHGAEDSIALWRVGEPDEPVALLDLSDAGIDLRPTPAPFTPSWLAFSADGDTLYASGAGPVSAIDLGTGAVRTTYDGLGGLALTADGTTMAVLSSTRAVRLVDTATGATVADLAGHDDVITAATFSRDGSMVATASNDETVAVWDTATGNRVLLLEGHAGSISDLVFDADGARLYTAAADRTIFEWDIDGSSGLTDLLTRSSIDVPSESSVTVSPAGNALAVMEEVVHLVDVGSGRAVTLRGTVDYEVAWGAFTPAGERFVTVDYTSRTRLWRTSDGELLATDPGRAEENLGAVAFTPEGESILLADFDGLVRELDGDTLVPTGHAVDLGLDEPPAGIRTGPDGRFAVTWSPLDTSQGTDIVFGDIDDERIDRRVHVDSWGLRAVFSADGSRYGWGAFDGRVGVVDVASGEVEGPADPVHTGPVSWLTFSPDGTTLASLGFDGFVTLSDATDARPRARFVPGAVNRNGALTYGPDGHTVVLGYRDGTVLSFDTDPATWVAHACEVAGRDLTADEWRDFFGDEPRRATC